MSENGFKYISLFSGAGGLDIGLERAGLEPALYVDIDPLCCETLRINRPSIPVIQSDIATLSVETMLATACLKQSEVFAVVGGPPCQPFSTGGKRQTLRDDRGGLFTS